MNTTPHRLQLCTLIGALAAPILTAAGSVSEPDQIPAQIPVQIPTQIPDQPATQHAADPHRPDPAPDPAAAPHPSILLVEADHTPTVEIEWTTADGDPTRHTGRFPYSADAGREELGGNALAFVAVGGTRLTKGAGHPRGAIVRVGFYKADPAKPWFRDITAGTTITVRLTGVRFNQPIDADPRSIVQHLKYAPGDMEACGIPGDARDQFNTADPRDTLNDRTRPGIDARLGSLAVVGADDNANARETDQNAAETPAVGTAAVTVRDGHTADLEITFRYPALRNLRDPWKSDLPGTFLEPVHFHVEFEALPIGTEPMPRAHPKN